MFLAFSVGAIWPVVAVSQTSQLFKVTFRFDLRKHSMTAQNFCDLRSNYEDDHKITLLNKIFIKKGWILNHSCHHNENEMVWEYVFKNSEVFDKWESSLYREGFVKKDGRPYDIERTYQLVS
jgi:hypothetical protein